MTIPDARTEQLDIFCRVNNGLTSDFLTFIVVELIRFFHGAHNIAPQYYMHKCTQQADGASILVSPAPYLGDLYPSDRQRSKSVGQTTGRASKGSGGGN